MTAGATSRGNAHGVHTCAAQMNARMNDICRRPSFPPLAGPMSDGHCWRLKRLLLSHWLCEPPAVPELRVSSTCSTVVATFRYDAPSTYNEDDRFELQVW